MSDRKKDCVRSDTEWRSLLEATLPKLNKAKKSYQNIEVPRELEKKIIKIIQKK